MKKIITLILLFISIISFGQDKEYRKATNMYNSKKYTEANLIIEKLLNKQYGELNQEMKYYVLYMNAGCYYNFNDFEKSYKKYNDLIDFVNNSQNLLNEADKEKTINSLQKYSEELKLKIPKEDSGNSASMIASASNSVVNTDSTDNKIAETTKPVSDDKTVTLTVSATGKTLEEARLNALRSAIEQAFGAFISSKTEILNDNVVKDEIVSIANGNIEKYNIISQTEIQNIGFAMTLNATVSIEKLTSFAQSRGILVEFEGGMFATKIMLQKLNEDSEFIAVKNLLIQTFKGLENSIDYSLNVNDPKLDNYKTQQNNNIEVYKIELEVVEKPNSNYNNVWDYFIKSLDKISLNEIQASDIKKTGKEICRLFVDNKIYLLRNGKSINAIFNFSMLSLMLAPNTFIIKNNIETVKTDSDRGKFFRAFISHYENTNDMNVSLITAPEQVDIIKTTNESDSLLNYVKTNGLNLEELFSDYKFFADEYFTVSKKDNNISIITTFDYCRGISDFNGQKTNLKYYLNYDLNELKKIKSFEIEKVPFEEILKNYKSYRIDTDRQTFGCFLIGTKISTPNGKINIENIKVGDKVICFDDKGEVHTSIVESVNKHDNQEVYGYSIWNSEPLFATPNHWVLTSENSFTEIGKLNELLTLVDINSGLKPVTKVEYFGKETVYNFIVKDYHTYIANDIRVHNGGKGKYKQKNK